MDSLIKKVVYGFFTLLLTSSCKETASREVSGTYASKRDTYNTRLVLSENGYFEYSHEEKLAKQFSKGSWKKEGNDIILNNNSEFTKGIKESKESLNEIDGIKIIIKDNNDDPIALAGIILNSNKNKGWNTDESGITEISDSIELESITIYFLNYQYFYKVKDKKNNVFELRIKLHDPSIKYFKNEKFALTKKGIKNSNGDVLIKE